MAQVKIDDVLDALKSDLRRALANAVHEVIPSAQFDESQLYRAFCRAARHKCSTWETVPDDAVQD